MKENQISPINQTDWIENLALDELNMDESGIVHFSEYFDPNLFIEEASLKFMDELRDKFEIYVAKFNEFRTTSDGQSNSIRLFKISNTINDFMLFRNSLKLIVARTSNDVVSLGILSNGRNPYQKSQSRGETFHHELKAHIGPFNDVAFKLHGEAVDIDALVRHYLTEFIKQSAS